MNIKMTVELSKSSETPNLFANLLLIAPYRPILNAIITTWEQYPSHLFSMYTSLNQKGIPFDMASTLPQVDQVANCSHLCPLREEIPEERGRILPCGHTFHETCLRDWFTARTCCLVCNKTMDVIHDGPPLAQKDPIVNDRMSVKLMAVEILNFAFERYPGHVDKWLNETSISGPFDKLPKKPFVERIVFSNLLIRLPYQSTLKMVLILYENEPNMLRNIKDGLNGDGGIPVDIVSTLMLDKLNRVPNCAKLCPLRKKREERCRMLYCGHLFHETCLRYWLRVHNFCPLCERKVEWSNRQPPLLKEEEYVKRCLEGMTLTEMAHEIKMFLKKHHEEFSKNL